MAPVERCCPILAWRDRRQEFRLMQRSLSPNNITLHFKSGTSVLPENDLLPQLDWLSGLPADIVSCC